MAATSWKRAANCTEARARVTRTTPSSSGWRSPSRTAGWNSPTSSKNSTPPLASETSPGRMLAVPPPTMATSDAVWCGARRGGRRTSPSGSGRPAAEWIIVVSNARSRPRAGSRPGRRWASMVLPAPGGPSRRRWWPPAAAASMARRAMTWPRTSARSGSAASAPTSGAGAGGGHGAPRASTSTSSDRLRADRTSRRATSAASASHPGGTTGVDSSSAATSGTTPGTLRTEPSSPSSPRKASPCTASAGTASAATRTPTAMARSSPAPLLRTPDGARLTVMRVIGQGSPLDSSAARTRSRASRQASSGRPTTLNAGRPLATWTSTETGRPSAPSNVADGTMASIAASLRWAGPHPRGGGGRARQWGGEAGGHGSRGL